MNQPKQTISKMESYRIVELEDALNAIITLNAPYNSQLSRKVTFFAKNALENKNLQSQHSYSEQESKWISIDDRLPEPYQKCLVVRIDGNVWVDIYQMFHGGKCDFLYQITHWMPLPEPPKQFDDLLIKK